MATTRLAQAERERGCQPPSVVMLTADRQIDRRILLAADSLEAAGWQVTIIAMPADAAVEADARVVRIGTGNADAKRESLVLGAYRWARGTLPMNGMLMRWLKRLAWRYLVNQESFYTRLFQPAAIRYSPTVFVANDLPMLPVAKSVAEACGAKLVYDSHELYCEQEFSPWEKGRWQAIEAKYIVACDAVITVNASIARELEKRYGLRKVNVIHNTARSSDIPLGGCLFHEAFALSPEKKVLLLQGGLSAGRNLEGLVTAMRHVQDESVVLVVLGDGVLSGRLKTIAKAAGVTNRVFFHQAVPQSRLAQWTACASAGVIPYQATCLNNYYCTPNKLFEFISAGLPILASDLPELRKMVDGEQIGLVGDMDSPSKIATLIDRLFADEQRFVTWQRNVRELRQRVCWEVEKDRLVGIYEALR